MAPIVPARGGLEHRASGHTCVGLPAEARAALPADGATRACVYRGSVLSSAFRSFWAEPPAPDPPARVWRDWVLLAVIVVAAVLETIFREDLVWSPVGLVVCVGLAVALPVAAHAPAAHRP